MSVTPFIRPIKIQGGSFYTCSSASEDLNYTLDTGNKKFRFSNFALLKIPEFKALTTANKADLLNNSIPKPNFVQLDSIIGASSAWYKGMPNIVPNIQNNNALAESFQNYYYNLEEILTDDSEYDMEEDRTISERAFFKWLKEIGAIRFREANNTEVVEITDEHGQPEKRFVEEDETFDIGGNPIYERVVKYLGNINVINSIRNPENSFTEVYVHVPVNHGHTRDPLFSSISDENYFAGKIVETSNFGTDEEYIQGRRYNDVHPAGLNFLAHYDCKGIGSFSKCWYLNPSTTNFERGPYMSGLSLIDNPNFKWWYNHTSPADNAYYMEPIDLEDSFTDPSNDVFAISHLEGQNPNNPEDYQVTKFIRSRLDGISLDFDPENYKKIATSVRIESLAEYNESHFASNFSFNTVLIYYDLYSVDDPEDYTTNLFGVLFLDNVDFIPGQGGIIPSMNKYKPNKILSQNGNSYAFRLNIKFDVHAEDASIEININDYNTFSLQLYLDALTKMKLMAERIDDFVNSYKNLRNELRDIKDFYFNGDSINELKARIDHIEKKITDSEEVFLNNNNIVNLINKTYEEVSNIYKNVTSVEMSYNLDLIKQGEGIEIDRSVKNQITLASTRQAFTLGENSIVSIVHDFNNLPEIYSWYHVLQNFDNYLRIKDGDVGEPWNVDKDIVIYVNDSVSEWKRGQKLRISFENGLLMNNTNGNFNFLIYSDSLDKLNSGYKYNKLIGFISSNEFSLENRNKPIIELICVDPLTFEFVVDVF